MEKNRTITAQTSKHSSFWWWQTESARSQINGWNIFVLRTGCQWNALNETGICSSSTAHSRFQEWIEAGVFLKLWKIALKDYDKLKGIDLSWQSMDGAMTKAPLGMGKET